MKSNLAPASRPTHIGVECRLMLGQAEAALYCLTRLKRLIECRVMTVHESMRDDARCGLAVLIGAMEARVPAFDPPVVKLINGKHRAKPKARVNKRGRPLKALI